MQYFIYFIFFILMGYHFFSEPPSLLVGLPEEQTLLINNENPLTLTCKGQGRPQPTIEWFKGNEMENLLSSNMSLYYSISNASTTKNTYSFEVTSTLYFKGWFH